MDQELMMYNSNSLATLAIFDAALDLITFDKPKQKDRLNKFYIKLKIAGTHKKKAEIAYVMLAILSDMKSSEKLNVVEKNKILNAINISKDESFIDEYVKFIKGKDALKIDLVKKSLEDFLVIEEKIREVNEKNRHAKQLVKEEKQEIKKEAKEALSVVTKKEEKKVPSTKEVIESVPELHEVTMEFSPIEEDIIESIVEETIDMKPSIKSKEEAIFGREIIVDKKDKKKKEEPKKVEQTKEEVKKEKETPVLPEVEPIEISHLEDESLLLTEVPVEEITPLLEEEILEIPEDNPEAMEDTILLPTEEEIESLLDTRALPVLDIVGLNPVSEEEKEFDDDLKSVDDIMDEILSKTLPDVMKQKTPSKTREEIIGGISQYINDNYRSIAKTFVVPYEEMENLKNEFVELRSYTSPYYNVDVIETLIETACIYKNIRENSSVDLETMMTLAINAHNLVSKKLVTYDRDNLESKEYDDARKLIANINLPNPIKVYEEAYNMFMGYYESLSEEEKRNIRVSIERIMPYEYKSLFEVGMSIPYEIDILVDNKKLKNTINQTVKKDIIENQAINFDQSDDKEIPMLLSYATVYMSNQEIIGLYHSLKLKKQKEIEKLQKSEDPISKEEYEKILREIEHLQESFASAILISESRKDSKLRGNLNNQEYVSECLRKITRNILGEEPLFIHDTVDVRVRSVDNSSSKDFYNSQELKQTRVRVAKSLDKLTKIVILNGIDDRKNVI